MVWFTIPIPLAVVREKQGVRAMARDGAEGESIHATPHMHHLDFLILVPFGRSDLPVCETIYYVLLESIPDLRLFWAKDVATKSKMGTS